MFVPELGRELALPEFADLGDAQFEDQASPSTIFETLSVIARGVSAAGNVPIFLGGDHSVTHPLIAGYGARPAVLHFDAHLDNDVSRNPGIADNASVMRELLDQDLVQEVISVGVRGFIPPCAMDDPRQKLISVAETLSWQAQGVLDYLDESGPIWVSIDLDALDPAVAPGVSTPVPNGLDLHTVLHIIGTAIERRHVIGVDIVEFAPAHDTNDLTAHTGALLALYAGLMIGQSRR